MKLLILAALLTLSTSATALSINTPTLDLRAQDTSTACPTVMNRLGVWLKRMFYPNPSMMN